MNIRALKYEAQMRDLKQRRLQFLHIFHQHSIPALKCEVRKLWKLVVIEV